MPPFYSNYKALIVFLLLISGSSYTFAQQKKDYKIIAYYTGNADTLAKYPLQKLTHIIYSFAKLRADSLVLQDAAQEKNVRNIVALKQKYPRLKIMISFGGWSACEPCSELFASEQHRQNFARSTVALLRKYQLDGIDLDWEYPAIEGFPGHRYEAADREHFTALVKTLRAEMGNELLLTFAAGGFIKYLEQSIDWKEVVPQVDFINLMTYDLVGGYATTTGHHTPLYSYRPQQESTDKCVRWLLDHQVPAGKLITGAAFYARIWEKVPDINNGLYQAGIFKEGVDFAQFSAYFNDTSGFHHYWDKKAEAPYHYNARKKLFATFDNERSLKAKANYVRRQNLGGIMFWELVQDKKTDGLVDVLYDVLGK